eukprot:CAMPEP_0183344648 /NCGR_PEP_ID=MMETSP0164_2-20130417/10272_1 /TAXON_ID=221442 /ORGANISM="Coccolithus pelagicus ssp braarudi, Strain PLY182g" /LENGTH=88 /DNA_ID=CAMNT_0025515671 /DNA_START=76 /DNA_END=339 /DNA_ORIENTATION=-
MGSLRGSADAESIWRARLRLRWLRGCVRDSPPCMGSLRASVILEHSQWYHLPSLVSARGLMKTDVGVASEEGELGHVICVAEVICRRC